MTFGSIVVVLSKFVLTRSGTMSRQTAPFHYNLFYNALLNLIGREPETSHSLGYDGCYMFRFEARNETERRKFAECEHIIQEWLMLFDLIPFRSRCVYGLLPRPDTGQENKEYLDITIVLPFKKNDGDEGDQSWPLTTK